MPNGLKATRMKTLRVITPVFNDWPSFHILLEELDKVAATLPFRVFVSAVNDGSTDPAGLPPGDLQNLRGAEILHLTTNVGHQRAIAIGLCVAVEDDDAEAILIMDADGEDPPRMIEALTRNIGSSSDFLFVAQRGKRSEKLTFKFGYLLYKLFFKAVTGKKIGFGNFSVLSRGYARRLVMIPDLWNNLSAAILRSRLPIVAVPIDRGRRFAGASKMSFTTLIVHGLSGISVYADTIFVRLLLLTVGLMIFSILLIAFVLTLRLLFPLYATPGWATTVTFGATILLVQVFFTTLSSLLMVLNSRVQRLILPIVDFRPYLSHRQQLLGARSNQPIALAAERSA